jgi:multicomponent Na+:H+ antiporter subunit E
MVVWLVVVWEALWEAVTLGTVLGGLVVAGLLVWLFPLHERAEGSGRVRPLAVLRFVGYFLVKLVESNIVVAWEVITPSTDRVNEGIVAVPISGGSDTVVAALANAISLTPGTLTVEVDRDPAVLYVHVLHLRTIEQVRVDVLELESYVQRALGTEDAIEEVERRLAEARAALPGADTPAARTEEAP